MDTISATYCEVFNGPKQGAIIVRGRGGRALPFGKKLGHLDSIKNSVSERIDISQARIRAIVAYGQCLRSPVARVGYFPDLQPIFIEQLDSQDSHPSSSADMRF
jgi:hypothetical protein